MTTYLVIALIQTIIALIACAAMMAAWRVVARRSVVIGYIVAAGLILRLVVGTTLFWISYLRIPIGRSLQLGYGFWFFGMDSTAYYSRALRAAAHGIDGILGIRYSLPSPFYTQVFAVALLILGVSPVVGLFLNAFAYLGSSAILVRLGGDDHFTRISLFALAFSPSVLLWSMQPLKDVFFMMMIIAFIGAAYLWERYWKWHRPGLFKIAAVGIVIPMILFAISGIRWYVGAMFVVLLAPFGLLVAFHSRPRLLALVAIIVLWPIAVVATTVAGRDYLVNSLGPVMVKGHSPVDVLMQTVTRARGAFDRATGATMIGVGKALMPKTPSAAPVAAPKVRAKPSNAATSTTVAPTPDDGRSLVSELAGRTPGTRTRVVPRKRPRQVVLPQTHGARLIAGTSAMLLPRFIGTRLGLVDIQGGRGLWLFAEIDTIWFDGLVAITIVALLTAGRERLLTSPTLWMVILTATALAAVLAYAVSNFGTFFRHRDMIFTMLLTIPPLVAAERMRRATASAGVEPTEDAPAS